MNPHCATTAWGARTLWERLQPRRSSRSERTGVANVRFKSRLKPLPQRSRKPGDTRRLHGLQPMPASIPRGFSLIEMIAALVVFAFAFGVLMEVAGSGLRAARRSSDSPQAALHAQTVLDSLGVGDTLQTGTDSGRFDERFDWQLDVREEEAPPSWNGLTEQVPVDLYRVELTVLWKDGQIERSAKFATLRARQPGLDAGAGK